MSIHSRSFRFIISALVFAGYFGVIVPNLMDVDPPLIVRILLKPAELIGSSIGPMILPRPNIGTPENPFYEGTPLDVLFGLLLVAVTSLFWPVVTYLALA